MPLNSGWREQHSQYSLFSGLISLVRFFIKEEMNASRGERPDLFESEYFVINLQFVHEMYDLYILNYHILLC